MDAITSEAPVADAPCASPGPVRPSYWVVLYDALPICIVGPFPSADLATCYGRGHQQGAGDDPRWQVLRGEEAAARGVRLTLTGEAV